MPLVFVSIGSNIERERNIDTAVRALAARHGPLLVSDVYETAPVGFIGPNFFNLVAAFAAQQPPERLREEFRRLEQEAGRARQGGERFCPRTLDIDVLLYGDVVRHDGAVDVPRAEVEEFPFVLGPLADLAPGLRHPENGLPLRVLWEQRRQPLKRAEFQVKRR